MPILRAFPRLPRIARVPDPESREALLGEFGERIIDAYRVLWRELTVEHPGVIAVTPSESDVLRIVIDEPGATITAIARTYGQHKSNTSSRVAALVEKGLLEKRACADDGRETAVYPTELTTTNLEAFRSVWASRLAPLVHVPNDELAVLVAALREISDGSGGRSAHGVQR